MYLHKTKSSHFKINHYESSSQNFTFQLQFHRTNNNVSIRFTGNSQNIEFNNGWFQEAEREKEIDLSS